MDKMAVPYLLRHWQGGLFREVSRHRKVVCFEYRWCSRCMHLPDPTGQSKEDEEEKVWTEGCKQATDPVQQHRSEQGNSPPKHVGKTAP